MRKKNGAARMIYIFVSRLLGSATDRDWVDPPRNYVKHNVIPNDIYRRKQNCALLSLASRKGA